MPTDKEFEDFFRQQLGDLEEAPPANGWHKIKADLKPWYRRYQWVMAAAVCGLLSVGALTVHQLSDSREGQPAAIAQFEEIKKTTEATAPVNPNGNKPGHGTASSRNIAQIQAGEPTASTLPGTSGTAPENPQTLSETPENPAGNGTFSGQKPTVKTNKGTKALVIAGIIKRPKTAQTVNPETMHAGKATKAEPTTQNYEAARNGNTVNQKAAVKANGQAEIVKNALVAGGTAIANQPESLARAENTTRNNNDSGNAENGSRNAAKSTPWAEISALQPAAVASQPLSGNAGMELLTLRGILAESQKPVLPAVLPLSERAAADTSRKKMLVPQPVWAIGAFISPRVTFRRYAANRTDNVYLQQAETAGDGTSDVMSVEGGLRLHRTVTPNLTLDGGLVVTHLKDQFHYLIHSGEVENVNVKGLAGNSAEVEVNYRYTLDRLHTAYTYAGLNLGATYTLKQTEENRFYVSGGAAVQFRVSSKTEHYRNGQLMHVNQAAGNSNPLNNVNSQVYAGFGFAHKVTPRLAVLAEPAATYFLGSVLRQQEAYRLKPYTFGVNVGLRFDL